MIYYRYICSILIIPVIKKLEYSNFNRDNRPWWIRPINKKIYHTYKIIYFSVSLKYFE